MPRRRQIDRWLLLATLLTAAFGIAMVASASAHLAVESYGLPPMEFAFRQLVAVAIGFVALLGATFVPLRFVTDRRIAIPALALTWIGLGAAYLQAPINGTHRWLHLPLGSFQPSALAKLTLPLALAALLSREREERVDDRRDMVRALVLVVVTCALVLREPDLGSAALLFAGGATIMLLAGAPWKPLVLVGGSAVGIALISILVTPYRRQRLLSFLGDPSYQVQQSLIAIGGGGVLGRGLGESLQKLFFLPQPHSDFIFAIVSEELGFVGAVATIVLLGLIVWRGLRAAWHAPSRAAALAAGGIAVTLGVQTLFNISVCTDLLPAKGIPLPLISAGGSDVVVNLIAIGLLLNVSKEAV